MAVPNYYVTHLPQKDNFPNLGGDVTPHRPQEVQAFSDIRR